MFLWYLYPYYLLEDNPPPKKKKKKKKEKNDIDSLYYPYKEECFFLFCLGGVLKQLVVLIQEFCAVCTASSVKPKGT